MSNTVKNTLFNNLVNYETNQSSASIPQNYNNTSIDPTSLSNLSKDQQIVEYHLIDTVEKQLVEEDK